MISDSEKKKKKEEKEKKRKKKRIRDKMIYISIEKSNKNGQEYA